MDEAFIIWDEISDGEIQELIDQMLGSSTFSFSGYVEKLLQGKLPFSLKSFFQMAVEGLLSDLAQEKRMYVSLLLLAVVGAVLSNFTNLVREKQVAQTAFYAVYLLFFSVLFSAFVDLSQIAKDTLENLLAFMRALLPSYFIAMTFTQGTVATSVYYEFALCMAALADYVLVQLVLPAIHIYFLLKIANRFSEREMFTKLSELIRDLIRFVLKTIFGVTTGINVVQGMILPLTARLKNTAAVKLASAIPGVGSTVSSVASTVLCAGTLVKNAVGVAGMLVVLFCCGLPLLRLVVSRFLFQLTGAVAEPVSDQRIVACIAAMADSLELLAYAVFVGTMMFVISIAIISTMTSLSV